MTGPAPSWTSSEIETLRKMANAGATAQEISDAIGRNRNAVLGRARRSGVVLLNAGGGCPAKPMQEAEPVVEAAGPPPAGVPFHLNKGCRWILADGRLSFDSPCCGKPRMIGLSWCAEHAARVFLSRRELRPRGAP